MVKILIFSINYFRFKTTFRESLNHKFLTQRI